MAGRHPLPEPGTPAYIGVSDQFGAAHADATRQGSALLQRAELRVALVPNTGPWAAALLFTVAPAQPHRHVCTHVDARRGPGVLYAPQPHTLMCTECFEAVLRRDITRPSHCAMCGTPSPSVARPHQIALAQHDLVLLVGRLCPVCLTSERRAAYPV